MEPLLSSIVINTVHVSEMLQFYGCLGLQFREKAISKGGKCHQSFIGPVELTLFESPSGYPRMAPDVQLTFQIKKIDELVSRLTAISGVQCLMDPTLLPDGKKAILLDPDGRAVELIEK